MKKSFSFFLVLFIISLSGSYGQESCRVLKETIAASYSGKCKKGLASGKGIAEGLDHYEGQFVKGLPHGKGIYTWATGEVYRGDWVRGQRHGSGTYSFVLNGIDTIIDGRWIDDKYAGPDILKPRIITNINVERYTIRKNSDNFNRVLVGMLQNGSPNTGISEFIIASSSGYQVQMGSLTGFEAVVFPVTIRLSYTTFNKIKRSTYQVRFEFEISEPGDWKVELTN
jgi:hypothetical protein